MKTTLVAKIFLSISILVIVGYISFSIWSFSDIDDTIVCKDLEINILDKEKILLISQNEIADILEFKDLNPIGKSYKRLATESIEKELLKNQTIKSVECFKTLSGKVKLNVKQRTPVFILAGSESFYVDTDKKIIPVSLNHAVYLPIVSGRITKTFATTQLFDFMTYISNDEFWNAQVEQVYVHEDLKVEIVTRVGDAKVMLGNIDNYIEKLDNLFQLYTQGFNKIGWNRYSEIDLRFKNQIVCRKNGIVHPKIEKELVQTNDSSVVKVLL
jgi:cell division protein FtsQ